MRSYQNEIQRDRRELNRLTKRLSEVEEEYAVVSEKLAGYQEGCQELAAVQEQAKQELQELEERQTMLNQSQQGLAIESSPPCLEREELDRILAAKRETQAIITENLAKQKELKERLAGISLQGELTQQEKRIQEDIVEFETQLHSLDIEKQKLIKCMSLLTAHKTDTYILLSGSREQQIATVAQYNQYLVEFVPVVQKIERQQQVPSAAFLSQDITLLLDKINILKLRQIDLKSSEIDLMHQVHELSHVLNDTALDYGWTTSLLRPDPQGVAVNNQSISQLRQEANDLLVVAPPGILAKMGLCAQWKKTLFDLIVRAKSMEELAESPAALRAQIIAEVENVLLECRHLTQRIFEACYKHLSACGNSLEEEYNKIQANIAALTKQLLHSGKQRTTHRASTPAADELNLRQSLQEVEEILQTARDNLRQHETAFKEIQSCGEVVTTDLNQEKAGLGGFLEQRAKLEVQKQEVINKLEQSRQDLTEFKDKAALVANKLAELAKEKATVASQIKMVTTQLEISLSPANEHRIGLLTQWVSRLRQYRPEGRENITARVRGGWQAQRGQKTNASADSIARTLVKPGIVVLETREWLLPVAVTAVPFTLEGGRNFSPVEEYVMKCIAGPLDELGSQAGIAELLGLSREMVEAVLASLLKWGLLRETQIDGISKYELTESGKESCQNGLVPAVLLSGTVNIALNAQYELIEVYQQLDDINEDSDCSLSVFRYCNHQEEQVLRSYFPPDSQVIYSALQAKFKEWYGSGPQEYATSLGHFQNKQDCKLRFAEIWLYDVIYNQAICHVWDFAQQAFSEKLTFALNSLEGHKRLEQVQMAFSKNKEWTALITKLQGDQGEPPAIPVSLYGADRHHSLLKAIDDLQEQLLLAVVAVVDLDEIATDAEVVKRLRSAVNRGAVIFIGLKSAHTAADKQRTAAHMSVLQNILDADGLPGVLIFDVEMLDSNMILVDNQYYLLSWLPWITYCSKVPTQYKADVMVCDKSLAKQRSVILQGLFLKQLEKQLLNGCLADEVKCITWFYALLKLSEHSYIREILADEALDKIMMQPDNILLKLLAVYVKTDKYDFGLERVVLCLTAKPDAYTKLTLWLDKLRTRNHKAYKKITQIVKGAVKKR